MIFKRDRNFRLYHENNFYKNKPNLCGEEIISNFAYPVITDHLEDLIRDLNDASIECRPLICGSISRQPFWYERYGTQEMHNANIINDKGLYVPNNQDMTEEEIALVVGVLQNHFRRSL
jgi:CDP-6-deoxy-D-xylo-4-hexulose-3-dehydrase